MAEEPILLNYLPISGARIIGFIPFPRVLVLCEMQSASSRIRIHVTMSISYDDNHYTTGTSHLTVCKRMSLGSFKNGMNKVCLLIISLIYMY